MALTATQQARVHIMRFVVLGGRQRAGVLSGRHVTIEVVYYAYRF
jgi:hypothetical protein